MSNNIEKKVVVITGGSSGIGEAIGRHLASKGATVVLGARREDKLKGIVNDIKNSGGNADYFITDVTKQNDVKSLVQHAVNKYGRIDVMINNAGLMSLGPVSALKVDEWDQMIDINIKGLLYGVAAALPEFEKQDGGHIINISSTAGLNIIPSGAVYCGTKFAVGAISEGIRMEVGSKIRTTCIEPGAVDTELKHGTSHSETSDFLDDIYDNIAIPADSIARAAAYAIEQPSNVDINEIVVRPTAQEF